MPMLPNAAQDQRIETACTWVREVAMKPGPHHALIRHHQQFGAKYSSRGLPCSDKGRGTSSEACRLAVTRNCTSTFRRRTMFRLSRFRVRLHTLRRDKSSRRTYWEVPTSRKFS